jgi:biopolymer transport protein ExbD
MRIRRAAEPAGSLIDITPLVDIMFTLIIFFLATTTFEREERDLKVNLPETPADTTLSSAPKVMVVNVREDGSYFVGNRTLKLAELQQAIAVAAKEKPDQKVLVRGDQRALHGHVAAAVLACKRAGVHEANIGYQLPQ